MSVTTDIASSTSNLIDGALPYFNGGRAHQLAGAVILCQVRDIMKSWSNGQPDEQVLAELRNISLEKRQQYR
jgi:hypothetical protein